MQDTPSPPADARDEARVQRCHPNGCPALNVLQGILDRHALVIILVTKLTHLASARAGPQQDQTTMSYSHACLRYLCLLEPSLAVPSILDRTYPSLTGLEEVSCTQTKSEEQRC